jgi:hypothetical protein
MLLVFAIGYCWQHVATASPETCISVHENFLLLIRQGSSSSAAPPKRYKLTSLAGSVIASTLHQPLVRLLASAATFKLKIRQHTHSYVPEQ